MSKQIKQVYDAAPSTTVLYNDLVYLGRSPYSVTDDRASLALNAYPSLTNNVYASKGGSNTNNNGTEAFPYADPYFAMSSSTGTSSNPKRIIVAPGTYSTTNFPLKPHTSIVSEADATLSLSGSLTLDASWSSEISAKFYCYNANISGTTDLDFTSTSIGLNILKFYNTFFGGSATFTDDAQGNEFQFWNCEFTTATFKSTVPRINKCKFSSTFTVQPSAGTGNTTLFVRNSDYAGNVVLTGASGSGITASIYGSPILGSITINTTHVGLDIDEVSYPQGGITYAGGATSAQVTVHRGDMGSSVPFVKTAGKLLRANGTNYVETTSTFADTYTASNLLYSNGANTVIGLPTANNGVAVTNASGVPSISTSTLPGGAFFAAAFIRWADASGSASNAGKQESPYASPFYGSDNNTGTAAFPKLIIGNQGIYTASTFAIKPNVWLASNVNGDLSATTGSIWDVSSNITLDSTWSSAGAGSSTSLMNINFSSTTGFDLDFSGATNAVTLNFINCTIGSGFTEIKGATSHIPNIRFIDGRIGSSGLPLSSVNATIKNHRNDGVLSIAAAGGGGAGTYIVDGSIITGSVSIQGSSGNVQALTITNSKLSGTLTLSNTFCTLSIDATSIPSAGITLSGGATVSQITIIGNAPTKSFNNAFTAQNGITPVAITSSGAAVAWDLNSAPNATHTATENTTLGSASNQIAGNIYHLKFVQHASAAKTFAFNSNYKFPGGVVPIVSTGLSAVDIFSFYSDGTNMRCIGIAQNIS